MQFRRDEQGMTRQQQQLFWDHREQPELRRGGLRRSK